MDQDVAGSSPVSHPKGKFQTPGVSKTPGVCCYLDNKPFDARSSVRLPEKRGGKHSIRTGRLEKSEDPLKVQCKDKIVLFSLDKAITQVIGFLLPGGC